MLFRFGDNLGTPQGSRCGGMLGTSGDIRSANGGRRQTARPSWMRMAMSTPCIWRTVTIQAAAARPTVVASAVPTRAFWEAMVKSSRSQRRAPHSRLRELRCPRFSYASCPPLKESVGDLVDMQPMSCISRTRGGGVRVPAGYARADDEKATPKSMWGLVFTQSGRTVFSGNS